MITVNELLEKLPDITIYAGHRGQGKCIKTISFIDSPSSVDWLKGGEVILTTAFLYKENADMQLKFVEKLIEMDVVALGIKIGRYINQIPEAIIDLANEHDFPIFGIGFDTVWSEIFTVFHTLRLENKKNLRSILSMDVILFDKLFRSSSWDSEAIRMNFLKCTGVPAAIVNENYEILSRNNGDELPTIERYCERSKTASKPDSKLLHIFTYANQRRAIFDYALYPGERLILCSAQDDIQEAEIEWIISLYKSIREKNKFMQDITILWEKFIIECLIEKKEENIKDYIRILKLRELQTAVVLFFSGHLSKVASDELNRLLRVALLRSTAILQQYTEIDGGDILMLYGKTEAPADTYCFTNELREILQKVAQKYPSCKIRVGSVVYVPEDLRKSYEDAKTASWLGNLLFPEDNLVFYRDICMFDVSAKVDIDEIRYLNENITSFNACKTLEIFLESANIKKAAELSFIHDNTMRYRLQRVEQCLNMDMSKPLSRICMLLKIKHWHIAQQKNEQRKGAKR